MAKSPNTSWALILEALIHVVRQVPAVAAIVAIGWVGERWNIDELIGASAELLVSAKGAKQVTFTGHIWAIPAFAFGALISPLLMILASGRHATPPPEEPTP